MSLPKPTEAEVARFMSKTVCHPCGCRIWIGAKSRGARTGRSSKANTWYGSFWFRGRVIRAHRFASECLAGHPPLPPGHERDHTCHFSLCVEPEHIDPVPHAINQDRRMARHGQARRA